MSRIICDTFWKVDKPMFGVDPNSAFNRRIFAVNDMYRWLYDNKILQNTAFEFRDLPDSTVFAVDIKTLEPYRKAMGESGLSNADLAIHHIFDEAYTPCMYSGAIEPGWSMSTYRSVDGCVGRSWECGLIQGLNTSAIYDVRNIQLEQGVEAAVRKLFSFYEWPVQEHRPLAQQINTAAGKKETSLNMSDSTQERLFDDEM